MFKAKILFIGPNEHSIGCSQTDILSVSKPRNTKTSEVYACIKNLSAFVRFSKSGKTVLANFLSDTTENVGGEYRPTQGVRILEFESQSKGSGDNMACEVELWDCSGDFKFESCWPALMKDSSGVVIIFNPDVPSHLKEIETWHSMFISSQGLQDNQCLLIAHHKPGSGVEHGRLPLASHLSRLLLIHSNLEEEPEDVRRAFRRYVGNVVNTMSESREREEMSIIT